MPTKTTKYCVSIFQGRTHKAEMRTISRGLVSRIQRDLDKVIKTPRDKTEIEVWIDSPGGDAHAAYKLALDLRHRCRRMTAIVPDLAKSAATLFVMGVDEIYMAHAAELGPLDVQISHPDRENEVVSGLDVSGSLEYLSQFALELILGGGAAAIEATELPRLEVLRSMQNFTARFLEPCVAKLDPHITRRAVYLLKVAERYAVELLRSRNLLPKPTGPDGYKEMASHLVNHYPVHEFVICRTEAKKLGLPITEAEKHPNWKKIKELHEVFLKGDGSQIFAVEEDKIFPKASQSGSANAKQKTKVANKNGQANKKSAAEGSNVGSNGGKPTEISGVLPNRS
jgi:hypothetical protein